ncbi:MAG: preprotein translocase subunit YajC [Neisseria sp.]|nr:preprotein translocase subunit YajC [Neisseria sp.]
MISIAYAADAAPAGSLLSSFAPLVLILVVFWFLVMRPQQQKYKRHQEMVAQLKRGDKIITSSGILGKITKVTDQFFSVEIADGVEIQIEKGAVSAQYDPAAAAQEKAQQVEKK